MFSLVSAISNNSMKRDTAFVNQLCFQIDVKKCLFSQYNDFYMLKHNAVSLDSGELDLLCDFLIKVYQESNEIKVLNSLIKLFHGEIKNIPESYKAPNYVSSFIDSSLDNLELPKIEDEEHFCNYNDTLEEILYRYDDMNGLIQADFTFLKWEDSLSQAYSVVLKSLSLLASNSISITPKQTIKRKILEIIPKYLVANIEFLSKKKLRLQATPKIFKNYGNINKFFKKTKSNNNDITIKNLDNINDPKLIQELKRNQDESILYTGGGLIKPSTFELLRKKFLHVHPGELPELKGADCFYWSILVKGYPSYSLIYQNEGIDTGAVIHCDRYCFPEFLEINGYSSFESYHGILDQSIKYYYDPMLRAITLYNGLKKYRNIKNLSELPSKQQAIGSGTQYHFMHPKLKRKVLDLMLKKGLLK